MVILWGLLIFVMIQSYRTSDWDCPSNDPVCGTDGNTYSNICEFNNAKIDDRDLSVLYNGKCLTKTLLSGKNTLSHKKASKRKNKAKSESQNSTNKSDVEVENRIPVHAADSVVVFTFSNCYTKCRSSCPKKAFVKKITHFARKCLRCCLS